MAGLKFLNHLWEEPLKDHSVVVYFLCGWGVVGEDMLSIEHHFIHHLNDQSLRTWKKLEQFGLQNRRMMLDAHYQSRTKSTVTFSVPIELITTIIIIQDRVGF